MKRFVHYILIILALSISFAGCSVDRYLADGEYLLRDVRVKSANAEATKGYSLDGYVRQTPNSNWFGAKVPLKIYCLSGTDTTKWTTRLLRKLGEDPEVYDTLKSRTSAEDMIKVLANEGYLKANVDIDENIAGKKLSLTYNVIPGERYVVRHLKRVVADPKIEEIVCGDDTLSSLLHERMYFSINKLNEERSRITSMLRNTGYYKFNKECISFVADTLAGSKEVDLTMKIRLHLENGRTEPMLHPRYAIGKIAFISDVTSYDKEVKTLYAKNGAPVYYEDKLHFRPSLLTSNTIIKSGELYNDEHQKQTYNNFTRLQAVSYSNIRMVERTNDTLDCQIVLNHARPKSISFDLEGTNSAGDLGAAASASFQHKNLFKGSETFTFKLRGAYEAITGLDGYDGHNYIEFGGEAKLGFPGFLLPYVRREFGTTHFATSEISLQYNMQNRPEFNRRVLTAAWRYRWVDLNQKVQHRFDLMEINYVYMPWISKTFKEQYLDSLGKTNAILKYNYENLLITKTGYTYSYNSLGNSVTTTYGKNAYTIKFNIETSGNIIDVLSKIAPKRNSEGQRTFCGIAYAQYVKGDFDFAKSIRIDKNNSIAFHTGLGIAYPYGNSSVLPFEKRYFAGGANSVRGWSVRSLGPGSYNGIDKGINFINQSGDIKLDLSLEYRAFLFWKINGAIFVDGGNIWTIREYADQPGGAFRLDEFYKQIAVSYGIGLRVNLDFFTIRFDAGMKAINPAYTGRDHYPIAHPDFSRDFAFHFAVGLPF